MSRCTILLVRHPEAGKNVEDRHGGSGTPLTQFGMEQCSRIAHYVQREYCPLGRCLLVGHDVPQVRETVQRLSDELSIPPIWDNRLRGIDLGAVAGLSRAEAASQWPDVAERLEQWRAGKLRIDHLRLPGAEPLEEFRQRVEQVFQEWLGQHDMDLLLVVCTRSTLIMLVNLVELANDFDYARYRAYDFGAGSVTKIEVDNSVPRVIFIDKLDYTNGVE